MLFDSTNRQIEPIWYNRGTGVVLVRYLDGALATIPVSQITSAKGSEFVASVIRTVRVP